MLDLIARIGTEFGISIVVSSHLLGEVERICDHLVALESGRLLRADTMTSFTGTSQVLVVEVDEGLPSLAAELTRRGVAARADGRVLLVRLEGDATYDAIRDAIAALGLPLNRLEQARRRVEELFRDDEAPEVRHDR
jgi:ABC-2 type transport system ATP-binding protein